MIHITYCQYSQYGKQLQYNRLFFLGANFFKWGTLSFSRNSLNSEIHKHHYRKYHMSNISYIVYMGNTIICRTLTMGTVIIVLYSCKVTTYMSIRTGVSKKSRSSALYVHKSILVCLQPFLAQGVYLNINTWSSHSTYMVVYVTQLSICAKSSSRPTIACSIYITYSQLLLSP